ncbi:MAG: RagB/SusD family nutrient uptake outer membrane protein [Ferruginibacter sp.]|nr:RagB/SusD family nutrient uptake outer membrane protein [Ferruginibacter sp.]
MKFNMKNIVYFLGAIVLFAIASCQKLDREIITDLSKTQIEKSFSSVSALLNAAYSEIPTGFTGLGGAMMASATDEAEYTSENSVVQNFNNGSWNAISEPEGLWDNFFRGIRKVNIFLVSTDSINLDKFKYDINSASQQLVYNNTLSDIKRIKYEGRFVRAFLYFELIKRYGGVPIMTSALSEADIPNIQRNTLQECVQFISNECDSAALNLPASYLVDNNGFNTNTANLGRATKGAALALKARLLLYAASDLFNNPSWATGYAKPELISLPAGDRNLRWKAAADAAKVVIDLPGTGYALFNNYSTLFRAFNNAELIFTRSEAPSNGFEAANYPIGFDKGQSGNTPSQDLVDAYDVKSTGKPITDPTSNYNPANPYADRDPRLGFTIVTNMSNLSTVSGVTRQVQLYTGGRDGKPINNASKTGYYLRKYVNESLNLLLNTTAVHSWVYFRLPEIWLNYAEALNEYSPGHADIKIYYDRVRGRTGVAMPLLPAGLNQAQVRDKIRNERRVEFAFEDHRAWDTRRWMIAPTTLGAPLRGVNIAQSGTTFTYTPMVVETRVFQPKMYLYPIPQGELNIISKLVQNPLW